MMIGIKKQAIKKQAMKILIFLFSILIKSWLMTLRYKVIKDERDEPSVAAIYAFWHGEQMSLLRYVPTKASALISLSKDGDLQTQLMSHFKIKAIRGSSSKGGMLALRKSLKCLENNENLLISVDGPRGPIYEAKEGVAYLSLISQKQIYFCIVHAHRAHRLKTWDQFLLPNPFSTIQISFIKISPPKIKEKHQNITLEGQVQQYLLDIQNLANAYSKS